jgi:AraC-like DNA-binding protein
MEIFTPHKYRHIRPADVYVSSAQWQVITADRENGIPHHEITTIRLTGNNFFDLFASLVENGGGIKIKSIARTMGMPPKLLSPAIKAMSGLSAHDWAVRYLHMKACDRLFNSPKDVSCLGAELGFSQSAFSHFFYRLEHCYPSNFWKKGSCRVLY